MKISQKSINTFLSDPAKKHKKNILPGFTNVAGDKVSWFADDSKLLTKIKVVAVEQKLRQVEKFRNEFFNVGHVVLSCWQPCIFDAVKHAVGQVKMSTLTANHQPQSLSFSLEHSSILATCSCTAWHNPHPNLVHRSSLWT